VVKGSITIDGVSLTVTGLGDDWLSVDLIPTTLAETTLGGLRVGSEVNLEGDIVGKYVAKASASAGVSEETLVRAGFL
jgi:riboflavin synthase